MPMQSLPGSPSFARRELRRQEIANFGDNLAWLNDPDLIPQFATTMHWDPMPGIDSNPHYSLGKWMTDRFVDWSEEIHSGLDFGTVFEKHKLSSEDRVKVRGSIRHMVEVSYGTGIAATSEIYRVVPTLAVRGSLDDPQDWSEIASRARLFGRELGRHGSHVATLAREYLVGGYRKGGDSNLFNPAKLELDAKIGITTVTPLDEIIEIAKDLTADHNQEGHSGTCVGLQASPPNRQESMFDIVWDAYGVAAAKYIYPYEQTDPADSIPAAEAPDPNLVEGLSAGLLKQMLLT